MTYETDVTDFNLLVVNKITQSIPARPVKLSLWVFHNVSSWQIQHSINHKTSTYYWAHNLVGHTWSREDSTGSQTTNIAVDEVGMAVMRTVRITSQFTTSEQRYYPWTRSERRTSQVERFWCIEDMSDTKIISKEEARCEELFRNKHKRTTNDRFEVSLPFRENPSILEEFKINALKQLRHLERRFQRDPQLQIQYISFMDEYQVWSHVCIGWYRGHEG